MDDKARMDALEGFLRGDPDAGLTYDPAAGLVTLQCGAWGVMRETVRDAIDDALILQEGRP